jgi:hypothetical protein
MGYLDNSTNNIILDAVLTDFGREALARNNGSFNIIKFSLGDDEVNYGIITKYGRTIGREKIEKNTPVFEALTNQNLALKHKLISIPTPLVYLPQLVLTSPSTTVSLIQGRNTSVVVTESIASSDSATELDANIADSDFDLYYPSLFLRVGSLNNAPGQVSQDALRTAQTVITASNLTSASRTATFVLFANSMSSNTFSTYGRQVTSGGNTVYQISTSIKIVGQNSGLALSIPVTISQS